MGENDYEERLREITRMVGEGAPADEILVMGQLLKDDMTRRVEFIYAMLNTLDHLVATFAPDERWQIGWSTDVLSTGTEVPKVASLPPRISRVTRTLEIAKRLLAQGARIVRTEEIVGRLQAEGDTLRKADLAVAVGNILTRSGEWQRVASGEYKPVKGEVTGVQ